MGNGLDQRIRAQRRDAHANVAESCALCERMFDCNRRLRHDPSSQTIDLVGEAMVIPRPTSHRPSMTGNSSDAQPGWTHRSMVLSQSSRRCAGGYDIWMSRGGPAKRWELPRPVPFNSSYSRVLDPAFSPDGRSSTLLLGPRRRVSAATIIYRVAVAAEASVLWSIHHHPL